MGLDLNSFHTRAFARAHSRKRALLFALGRDLI